MIVVTKSLYIHKRCNVLDSCIVVNFLFGLVPFLSNVVYISHILLRAIILIDIGLPRSGLKI